MQTFLICLFIIVSAFAIALLVWWLFKPKRKTVVFIRPSTTRPNIIHKQGSGFGLDLGNRVVEEQDLAQQHAVSIRQQIYQTNMDASRRAAEQNRRDEAEREAWLMTQHHRSEPSCRSSPSSDSSSSSSCDSGSSSSSSSLD